MIFTRIVQPYDTGHPDLPDKTPVPETENLPLVPAERLRVECFPLVLGKAVTGQTGRGGETVVQVTDKEVVDVGDIETVITKFLIFLQADGVIHRLDGIAFPQVVLAEDEQSHTVPTTIETVTDLGHLAFQDTAHGERHPPIR